jgi:hypothetical protein
VLSNRGKRTTRDLARECLRGVACRSAVDLPPISNPPSGAGVAQSNREALYFTKVDAVVKVASEENIIISMTVFHQRATVAVGPFDEPRVTCPRPLLPRASRRPCVRCVSRRGWQMFRPPNKR